MSHDEAKVEIRFDDGTFLGCGAALLKFVREESTSTALVESTTAVPAAAAPPAARRSERKQRVASAPRPPSPCRRAIGEFQMQRPPADKLKDVQRQHGCHRLPFVTKKYTPVPLGPPPSAIDADTFAYSFDSDTYMSKWPPAVASGVADFVAEQLSPSNKKPILKQQARGTMQSSWGGSTQPGLHGNKSFFGGEESQKPARMTKDRYGATWPATQEAPADLPDALKEVWRGRVVSLPLPTAPHRASPPAPSHRQCAAPRKRR